MAGYTQKTDPDTTARAIGKEIPSPPSSPVRSARMLRGKNVTVALKMLEEVAELKRPVPIRRYNIGVAHKQGVGPGRYPQKAAKAIHQGHRERQVQRRVQGLGRGQHAAQGHRRPPGTDHRGQMPGRMVAATHWNQQTVNIEVILEEME